MAFEKGNKLGELARGVPKPQHAEKRKYQRSLAMAIRDQVHPDKVIEWLVTVWQGRDPLTNETVPLELRDRALKTLLDRGWGQAAQMLVVEGEIRHEATASAPKPDRLPMTLEQINRQRHAIRALLEGTVIDAQGHDV